MIRAAVVHLLSDQPVLADLLEMPSPADLTLVCRNVRTLDGRRPVFADRSDSTFVFPYAAIRFVEIPRTALEGGYADDEEPEAAEEAPHEPEDLELDEEFLRKVREV